MSANTIQLPLGYSDTLLTGGKVWFCTRKTRLRLRRCRQYCSLYKLTLISGKAYHNVKPQSLLRILTTAKVLRKPNCFVFA